MEGTILTLGGGGFSVAGELTALDRLLLELTGKDRPQVCFVGTASGDDPSYALRFMSAYGGSAVVSVLSLFNRFDAGGWRDPSHLLEQDAVFVGGGSTANLLAVWRLHGLPAILARTAAGGTVLAGISAGMNCWFEGSSTDSFGPLAPLADGLGMLPGSACPHYFGEAERQAAYHSFVASGALPDGVAADDGVGLLWRDGELVEAVSERPGGQAFRVSRQNGASTETPIEVRDL